ncbi:MAG: GNAT family N-acetyltransferase, partial [Armatimonadetes bacterium]|nr:GNAT family N-acetyltransferase [Armatimonadota bacterium]
SSTVLRPFDTGSDADYEALAALIRATKPGYARTVAELRDDDATYTETGKPWTRLFAVDGGGVPVGFAEFRPALYQPGVGKFYVALLVMPEHQRRGIGKALYAALSDALSPHDPTYLKIEWREDMTRAVRFFTERGYKEVSRYYESRLDIAAFDFAPFAGDFDRPLSEGIEIVSWRELKATDADASRKLWAVSMEISPDVPSDEPFEIMDYDSFQSVIMNRPNLDPDGVFVAVDTATGDYAALSHIWRRGADNDLDTGLTGTKREYRRKGIALALKLRIIRWAQSSGFTYLRTGNEVGNRPMLAINERLGFVKQPAWIEFVWRPG